MICEALCEIRIKNHGKIHTVPTGRLFKTLDIATVHSLVRSNKIEILPDNIYTSVKQSPQCPQRLLTQDYQGFHTADMDKSKSAMSAFDDGADHAGNNRSSLSNINGWDAEMQELITWFLALTPPAEPFYLQPHMHVIDPGKFFESLKREIETGPRGTRARLGTLQSDLMSLRSKFGGNCESTICLEIEFSV